MTGQEQLQAVEQALLKLQSDSEDYVTASALQAALRKTGELELELWSSMLVFKLIAAGRIESAREQGADPQDRRFRLIPRRYNELKSPAGPESASVGAPTSTPARVAA